MERYDIYYVTDRKHLLKENITKEEAREFLRTLTAAEKTHIHIVEVPSKSGRDEREEGEER